MTRTKPILLHASQSRSMYEQVGARRLTGIETPTPARAAYRALGGRPMVPELDEHTLLNVLLDPAQRDALLAAMEGARDSALALHYGMLVPQCQATPEQLRTLMSALDT